MKAQDVWRTVKNVAQGLGGAEIAVEDREIAMSMLQALDRLTNEIKALRNEIKRLPKKIEDVLMEDDDQ